MPNLVQDSGTGLAVMKKNTMILALMVGITAGASALGLGVQGNIVVQDTLPMGMALAISPDRIMHMSFNWNMSEEQDIINSTSITADWWLVRLPFKRTPLSAFLGAGLYASLSMTDTDFNIGSGLRMPLGISAGFANNHVELYLQTVPTLGLYFKPTVKLDNPSLPINLGIRFWIE
ncbi:MAG: DUF3996 domain-containing protein [Spirochaetaceae bacterium]|nr:DUF3996 domain-containing protein [Spirochaetaceae bacterium]